MANKEATARIKINRLLEKADWRFFANERGPANIQLEPKVKLKLQILDALGDDFEKGAESLESPMATP
jgi:type I restriction enzyme, R subunit